MTVPRTLFATLLALAGITSAKADNYKIDPVHSAIMFKAGHFVVGNIYGRFDSFSGDFVFDANDPTKESMKFEIKNDDINSNSQARDKHPKIPNFLNPQQFPTTTSTTSPFNNPNAKDS